MGFFAIFCYFQLTSANFHSFLLACLMLGVKEMKEENGSSVSMVNVWMVLLYVLLIKDALLDSYSPVQKYLEEKGQFFYSDYKLKTFMFEIIRLL